jgi:pSer/pThr/pTyr-binding forkhead associated (FHA) protein
LSILYRPVDKKFKFKDEQSSNGTFVNDVLMDEGELHNFDVIRIGATKLVFIAIPQ